MTNKESNRRICVSIGETSQERALAAAETITEQADVIEVRLDCLEEQDVTSFVDTLAKPLLFTNRPDWEGGNFKGEEGERLSSLVDAISKGAAYVDLEYRAPKTSLKELTSHLEHASTRLILSWHDFETTPMRDELLEIMVGMHKNGADIGKIVTTAHSPQDVLRVLRLQEDAARIDFPLIAFCMGKAGIISRLATLELGGYMTYCSADEENATAPGQVSVGALREIYARLGL